jgi:hypothetical protein
LIIDRPGQSDAEGREAGEEPSRQGTLRLSMANAVASLMKPCSPARSTRSISRKTKNVSHMPNFVSWKRLSRAAATNESPLSSQEYPAASSRPLTVVR